MARKRPEMGAATSVAVSGSTAKTKLHPGSIRKSVVDFVMSNRGRATWDEIDVHFNCEMAPTVCSLLRDGWLIMIVPEQES